MPVDKDKVHVFVFGPGYGESTLLYIPEIGWGLIDSCLYRKKSQKVNPALGVLSENNVDKLAFVVLTHPHKDHYLGLEDVLDQYLGKIERIGYYNGDGIREYRAYLAKNEVLGTPGLRALGSLFRKFKKARDNGASYIKLCEKTQLLSKTASYGDVEVVCLTPSASSVDKYKENLFKAIPKKEGDVIDFVSDKYHNLISAAFLISVGGIKIFLGGDVEIGGSAFLGWKGVLENIDCPDLSSHLVKVPHHGSGGAFHEPLWEKISVDVPPISVITPYVNAKEKLPKEEVIKKIANYSEKVVVTSSVKLVKPKKVYDRVTVKNMRQCVKTWRCVERKDDTGYAEFQISLRDGFCKIETVETAYVCN